MERWTRARTAGLLLALTLLAACSEGGHTSRPPKRLNPSTPAANPAEPSAEDQVDAHRQQALADYAKGKDAPDRDGLSVAGSGSGSTMFFWSTTDGRYCVATYRSTGGSAAACHSSGVPLSRTPRLHRLYEGDSYSARGKYGLFVAADRQTIESVTCGGAPVALREIRVVRQGAARRTIYALELDGWTAGILTARVRQADGGHTVRLPLGEPADDIPADSDWRVCDSGQT